jgi:hypothetical protein
MPRPSKVDRLAPEIRDMIGRLREQGLTIDEILAKLRELDADVGRTGLANHLQRFDAMRERLHASRAAAEAIVARLDQAGDDRVARLNIASLHAGLMELMAGEDGEPVPLDPKSAKLLSETMRNLAQAKKADQETAFALKRELDAARAREEKVKAAAEAAQRRADGGDKDGALDILRTIREAYGI